ncbi:hypothetical protein ACFQH8_01555 [Halomicroarcula sp. GCM10025710]
MISGRSQRLGRIFLSLVLGSVLTIVVFRIQALLPLSVGILTLRPLAATAVVVGYRGGIAGVGGVALGYSSYVVYHQTLGPLLLLEGVGFVILGVGAATLVAERPVSLARSPPELRNGPRLRYALIALFGVCVSVSAVLAAAYEVLALADFYPFAATRVTELTVSMLLFAVPTLVVTDRQPTASSRTTSRRSLTLPRQVARTPSGLDCRGSSAYRYSGCLPGRRLVWDTTSPNKSR